MMQNVAASFFQRLASTRLGRIALFVVLWASLAAFFDGLCQLGLIERDWIRVHVHVRATLHEGGRAENPGSEGSSPSKSDEPSGGDVDRQINQRDVDVSSFDWLRRGDRCTIRALAMDVAPIARGTLRECHAWHSSRYFFPGVWVVKGESR